MKKIKVVDDPELTRLYPKYYATVVTATRDDGQTFTKRVDDIPGFATRPMQRADFTAKFKKNVVPVLGAASPRTKRFTCCGNWSGATAHPTCSRRS